MEKPLIILKIKRFNDLKLILSFWLVSFVEPLNSLDYILFKEVYN